MNTLVLFLLLGSPLAALALIAAWVVAERRNAPLRRRMGLGLAALAMTLPCAMAFAIALTQLDDNSYYAASVRALLDETVDAVEAGEPGFAARLREFRARVRLSYETRDDLLEKARAFRADGESLRARL
jgi:hypothetical protein